MVAAVLTSTTTSREPLSGSLAELTTTFARLVSDDAVQSIVEVPVEDLLALETGGVGDPVDRIENRIDLQLVGLDFLIAQASLVGLTGSTRSSQPG